MVSAGEAVEGCLDCGRNIEKANCGKVFGKKHKIAFQLNHLERIDSEDAASLAPRDMHIYATGCYPAKSDATNQMIATPGELEKVRARVNAHAANFRCTWRKPEYPTIPDLGNGVFEAKRDSDLEY